MTTPPPCQPCNTARQYPQHRLFNPACLHCGARMIQMLGTLRLPPEQIAQRRRNELAIWVEHGHSEAQIRALSKGELAIGPAPALASDNHRQPKSR